MRKYLTLIISLFFAILLMAENVTNVRVQQDGKNVVITYDLNEGAEVRLFVSVEDSAYQQLHQVSGDIGPFVQEGKDRVIIWEPLREYEKFAANRVRFMVDASLYECVDLGLSVKWATEDLCVKTKNGAICYFAWGDTTNLGKGKIRDERLEAKSLGFLNTDVYSSGKKFCKLYYTKYCTKRSLGYKGFIDNKTVLDLDDDIATTIMGGRWRMPTYDEVKELFTKCTWEKDDGFKWRVTGPNGNSIYFDQKEIQYWSSTIYREDPRFVYAYGMQWQAKRIVERKGAAEIWEGDYNWSTFLYNRNLKLCGIRPVCQ